MHDLTLPDRRRLTYGLLFSLTIHAMLLNLVLDGQGLGLPGFSFPWQDRRTEVPDLHLILLSKPVPAAEPLLSEDTQQPGDAEATVMKKAYFAPPPKVSAVAGAPQANPEKVGEAKTVTASAAASAISPLPVERPDEKRVPLPLPKPAEDVIAVAKSDQPTLIVPPAVAIPPLPDAADARQDAQQQAEQIETERQEAAKQAAAKQDAARQAAALAEAARIEAERQEATRQEVARAEAARVETERQETAKQAKQVAIEQDAARQVAALAEAARMDAERQEAAKQTAASQAAARQEVARQEVARAEVAKVETERREAAKKAAAQQLASLQEAARAETMRAEADRKEAARQEAARQAAAQQDAARQEATRGEATRSAALQAEEEKREEKLRAIGRQLNEEAARREAAAAQRQLPSASSARRGRLFGLTDPNAELILYAQAWSRKITLNMTFDMVREAAKQPHANPVVTVAIRSDGSVESIIFVVPSGVPAIDEAIRRIVYSQANYQAFPPGLVKDFDVIEIRRTWYFDMAIRLY